MLKRKVFIFAVTVILLICYAIPVVSGDAPGYSGMAQVSDNTFLVVNDRKTPIEKGYRLGIISLTATDGIFFTPVNVADWMDEEGAASDLESCCAIPGREGEFLIAESGFYDGRFGRIFHVTLSKGREGFWSVTVNGIFRIYTRELDEKSRSYQGDEVEGINCFHALGKTILVYGERGGAIRNGWKRGTIVWGAIDFSTYRFDKLGEAPLVNESVLGDRDCSDLHVVSEGDGTLSVYSVATRDGGDNGPFRSMLYRAGCFIVDREEKTIRFAGDTKPEILADLSGIKVEALAGPAGNIPESDFSIATDDEHFGGIWRPVSCE